MATIIVSSRLIDKALQFGRDEKYKRSEIRAYGKLNETQIYLLFIGNLIDISVGIVILVQALDGTMTQQNFEHGLLDTLQSFAHLTTIIILCLFMISYARVNKRQVELKFTSLGEFIILKTIEG